MEDSNRQTNKRICQGIIVSNWLVQSWKHPLDVDEGVKLTRLYICPTHLNTNKSFPSDTSGRTMPIGLGPNVNAAGVFVKSFVESLFKIRDGFYHDVNKLLNPWLISREARKIINLIISELIITNSRRRNEEFLSMSEMRSLVNS